MRSTRQLHFRGSVFLLMLFAVACERAAEKKIDAPSIVFFLIDDLGWMDTGVYGSRFYETPNIDRLARESARFTQFYTAGSVCSPTRASIVTGKHPARLNITNWIPGRQEAMLRPPDYLHHLPLEEITIAEALGASGYATGYIGKWHLGAGDFRPEHQGFATSLAVNNAGLPGSYFYPYKHDRSSVRDVPDLDGGQEGDYLTDRVTDLALEFLDQHRDQRFLLLMSHYAVHTPLQSKPELIQKYEAKAKGQPASDGPTLVSERPDTHTKQRQDHATYGGMVESMDESVGRILDKLAQLSLEDDTVVIFVSDNGGLSTLLKPREGAPTSNLPLRAGKGWLYEGGIRVPLLIRWPGVVEGGTVVRAPSMTTDLYPTMLEMAGLPLDPTRHQDGRSLVPLFGGAGEAAAPNLYWHYPHYHGSGHRPSGAIRSGDFKLIEWFEDGHVELYNLAEDIGEMKDLVEQMPEKTEELRGKLETWREEVDARMPTPNPAWNPESP